METTMLKLKFSPPDDISGPSSFQKILSNICSSSNPKETTMEKEEDSVYVHPLSRKSSFSKLSEKSFEMCTENLGSETGSDDIIDSTIFSNSPIREISSFSPREYSKNKVKSSRDFPPPLTSISGGGGRNSIQVRPHRENGRLVIRAVETLATRTFLRSERSNGRLCLSISKNDDDVNFEESESEGEDDEIDLVEKNDENYINDEDLEEGDVDDQELGRGPTVSAPHFAGQLIQVEEGKVSFKYMNQNEIDDQEVGPRPTISSLYFASRLIQVEDCRDGFEGMDQNGVDEIENEEEDMDMDGNNFEIEVEMGMEKFHKKLTRRRCNQVGLSNKELYNWEPLWVATSQVELLFWISLQCPKNTTIFSVYLC